MDVPLALNYIKIRQGFKGDMKSSAFCQNMADVGEPCPPPT